MYEETAVSKAFLMKSARISVPSSSANGFVHLGSARGIKLTEKFDIVNVETDNAGKVFMGYKNQEVMVEGNLLELNFQKIARMRGGYDTFSTATFTFDTGGNLTVTPQTLYLTSISPTSSESIQATIYYSYVTKPLVIPFPSDDKTDVAEIPFEITGYIVSTRTVGQQLYSIVDGRSTVYESGYASTGA